MIDAAIRTAVAWTMPRAIRPVAELRFMIERMLISFPVRNQPTKRDKTTRLPAIQLSRSSHYPHPIVTACFMNTALAVDSKLNRGRMPQFTDIRRLEPTKKRSARRSTVDDRLWQRICDSDPGGRQEQVS